MSRFMAVLPHSVISMKKIGIENGKDTLAFQGETYVVEFDVGTLI